MEYSQYIDDIISIKDHDDDFVNLRRRVLQEGNYELGFHNIYKKKNIRWGDIQNPLNAIATRTNMNILSWKVTTKPKINRMLMTRSDALTQIYRLDHNAEATVYKLNEPSVDI
mgnify:CR=1 FL=1